MFICWTLCGGWWWVVYRVYIDATLFQLGRPNVWHRAQGAYQYADALLYTLLNLFPIIVVLYCIRLCVCVCVVCVSIAHCIFALFIFFLLFELLFLFLFAVYYYYYCYTILSLAVIASLGTATTKRISTRNYCFFFL